ncbi:PDZ domain-containing protein [Longimicrobium sp.]|uniref:PDZ domain-containing protein n=1 Tax=Longimicrobium sp. TaxID=2029185 RepID=UPI002E34863A|nr:PDZ domain-containing protein [Longimicrobium sp.]HEX6037991.1 PDZ domain-containing protein [Longimicrobium sp.]
MRLHALAMLAALAVSAPAAAQTASATAGTTEIPQPPATAWVGMGMEQQGRTSELGTDLDPPVVTSVAAGSPAEAAGLRAGDQILRIDGCDTREPCVNWRQLVPGRRYQLRVRTGGEERDVTLVPAPPRTPSANR